MTNTTNIVTTWANNGRTFTAARNAGIMRMLASGDKQIDVSKSTGVDKADVNKLNKLLKELTDTQLKSLKRLAWPSEEDAGSTEAIKAWAKFGSDFGTRKKETPAGRITNETSPLDKFNAAVATVVALLAANPEEEPAWVAFLLDSVTPEAIAAERIIPEETEELAAA